MKLAARNAANWLVRCKAMRAVSASGGVGDARHHRLVRTRQTTVKTSGYHRARGRGATCQWVATSSQVLAASITYISGTCVENARYCACSSAGLSVGSAVSARSAASHALFPRPGNGGADTGVGGGEVDIDRVIDRCGAA